MSTTQSAAENATDPEHRSIDHDRYTRACAEEMAVEPLAPNMLTVEHGGENYDVDLVSGTCDCADAHDLGEHGRVWR